MTRSAVEAFQFYTIEDLTHLPEPKWLVEGLFEQDALVMLVGPPGSFKSFLAIDWALSLALGRPWNGRAVAPSRVLYALGEGKASLLKRINAWAVHHQLSRDERNTLNTNFKVAFNVPQLASVRDADTFIEAINIDDFNPTVLIIDTLARSYVGKNENDPMDAGVWVDSVDKLRQKNMTVLVVHHTKKNTEGGLKYRGTTAFLGAMDTSFVLERNPEGFKGFAKLYCDKQKDHQEPEDIWLRWEQIRSPGDSEGSIVLLETKTPQAKEAEENAADEAALQLMLNTLMSDGSFNSDRQRARVLADKTGIMESAAQSRISRARRTNRQAVGA